MKSEWRQFMTAAEAYQIGLMERGLARKKEQVAAIQKARKAIVNRAVQRKVAHHKLGVDKATETP